MEGGRTRGAGGALVLWVLVVLVVTARLGGASLSQEIAGSPDLLCRHAAMSAVANAHWCGADSTPLEADAAGLNQYHQISAILTKYHQISPKFVKTG